MKESSEYGTLLKALKEEQQRLERKQAELLERRVAEPLGRGSTARVDRPVSRRSKIDALINVSGRRRLQHHRSGIGIVQSALVPHKDASLNDYFAEH